MWSQLPINTPGEGTFGAPVSVVWVMSPPATSLTCISPQFLCISFLLLFKDPTKLVSSFSSWHRNFPAIAIPAGTPFHPVLLLPDSFSPLRSQLRRHLLRVAVPHPEPKQHEPSAARHYPTLSPRFVFGISGISVSGYFIMPPFTYVQSLQIQ